MDHQQLLASPLQPIYAYGNDGRGFDMAASSPITHHPFHAGHHDADESDGDAIKTSSTRSPTTVFAVDEISSVFRVADDAIERGAGPPMLGSGRPMLGGGFGSSGMPGMLRRARCLTPSFTTDGELSTFSEDTEESTSGSGGSASSSGSEDELGHFRFPVRPRRAAQASATMRSIFRPVSGIKRGSCHYDNEDGEEETPGSPSAKRSCSAPTLCHANPIGGGDSNDYNDFFGPSDHGEQQQQQLLSPSRSFASPFKRVCRTTSISSSFASSTTSPYTSLFAEVRVAHHPATISPNGQLSSGTEDGALPSAAASSTMAFAPYDHLSLDHPLSLGPKTSGLPFLKRATSIGKED